MRTWLKAAAVAGLSAIGAAAPAAQSDFQWHGQLFTGQAIEIKGINGDVHATAAGGGEVEVTATRSSRRSNPADVRIELVPHAGGVTICAVYPDVAGQSPNRCEPGASSHSHTRDNDTVVNFVVRVPAGVGFVGSTVNGEVEGESLTANAEGHTVNGSVRLSTTGLAVASTVNGSITASMGRADWPSGASFKTVNGGITLNLPSDLSADLRADTLNGSIVTDFPITFTGQVNRRRLQGTVGGGGRSLTLSTVNGSIKLLRNQ